MGADITGSVEIYRSRGKDGPYAWYAVIKIDDLVYRNYYMFGSLFGFRDGYGFRPIAPGRGTPPDISEHYTEAQELLYGRVGETWLLGSELAAVDWEEEGEDYYEEATDTFVAQPGPGRRRMRRKDALHGGWRVLVDLIERLGQEFGPEHVRLLVYFDMA